MPLHAAITKKHPSRVLSIHTPIKIGASRFDGSPVEFKQYEAIWDTGATHTCITQKIVNELGLIQTGVTDIHTAGGPCQRPSYLINAVLRTNHEVQGLKVTLCDLHAHFDVLIGMDLITLGDMAVTNVNSQTTFTFRSPSQKEIDFCKEIKTEKEPPKGVAKIGRNDPCPCNSGRKYKKCCGK